MRFPYRPLFRVSSPAEFPSYVCYNTALDDPALREELNAPEDCRHVFMGAAFHSTSRSNAESILRNGPTPQAAVIRGSLFGFHRTTRAPAFWCSSIPLQVPAEAEIEHLAGEEIVTLLVKVSWNRAYDRISWDGSSWPCIEYGLQPEDVDSVQLLDDWQRFRSKEVLKRLELGKR